MRRALGAIVIGLTSSGCVLGAADRPARGEPPPGPLPEIRYAAPAQGMVWVAGSWHWDGTNYVWIPGRWESPPPVAPSGS